MCVTWPKFWFSCWLLLVIQWLLLVSARYLVITGGYCSLLVVTAHYRSLLLVLTFSMNVNKLELTVLQSTIPSSSLKIGTRSSKPFPQGDIGTRFRDFKGIIVRRFYHARVNGLACKIYERSEHFHPPLGVVLFHDTRSNNSRSSDARFLHKLSKWV